MGEVYNNNEGRVERLSWKEAKVGQVAVDGSDGRGCNNSYSGMDSERGENGGESLSSWSEV